MGTLDKYSLELWWARTCRVNFRELSFVRFLRLGTKSKPKSQKPFCRHFPPTSNSEYSVVPIQGRTQHFSFRVLRSGHSRLCDVVPVAAESCQRRAGYNLERTPCLLGRKPSDRRHGSVRDTLLPKLCWGACWALSQQAHLRMFALARGTQRSRTNLLNALSLIELAFSKLPAVLQRPNVHRQVWRQACRPELNCGVITGKNPDQSEPNASRTLPVRPK